MTTARDFRSSTYSNPAILKAGSHAAGVWMLAGCWARATRSGDFLPREAMPQIAPDLAATQGVIDGLVAKLIGSGLLEVCEGGWRIRYAELLGKPRVLSTKSPQELSLARAEAGRKGAAKRWAHKHAGASMPTIDAPPAARSIPKTDSKLPFGVAIGHPGATPPYRSEREEEDEEDAGARRHGSESETEHKHETGEAEVDEAAVLTLDAGSVQDRVADEIRRVRRIRALDPGLLRQYAGDWVKRADKAGVDPLEPAGDAVKSLAAKLVAVPDMPGVRALTYLDVVVRDLIGKATKGADAAPSSRPSARAPARQDGRKGRTEASADSDKETPQEAARALLEMALEGDRELHDRRLRNEHELRKCAANQATSAPGIYSLAEIMRNGGKLPPLRQAAK